MGLTKFKMLVRLLPVCKILVISHPIPKTSQPAYFPPYGITPWEGKEDQSLAVILNPTHLVSVTPVGVRLNVSWSINDLTDYDIYTVDLATGLLQFSGHAYMQPDGELWSAPDSNIFEPGTIIFVPSTPEESDPSG